MAAHRHVKLEFLEYETPYSLREKMRADDQFKQRALQPVLQIFDHPVQQITNTRFSQFHYKPAVTVSQRHKVPTANGKFGTNLYLGTRAEDFHYQAHISNHH